MSQSVCLFPFFINKFDGINPALESSLEANFFTKAVYIIQNRFHNNETIWRCNHPLKFCVIVCIKSLYECIEKLLPSQALITLFTVTSLYRLLSTLLYFPSSRLLPDRTCCKPSASKPRRLQ